MPLFRDLSHSSKTSLNAAYPSTHFTVNKCKRLSTIARGEDIYFYVHFNLICMDSWVLYNHKKVTHSNLFAKNVCKIFGSAVYTNRMITASSQHKMRWKWLKNTRRWIRASNNLWHTPKTGALNPHIRKATREAVATRRNALCNNVIQHLP